MPKIRTLEAIIQADIVKYLSERKIYAFSIPNEGAGASVVRTAQLISMGLRPGVADLCLWLGNGRVAYLEVKNEVGKQSEAQKRFEARCKANGYPYYVVRSVRDVQLVLEELNPQPCPMPS